MAEIIKGCTPFSMAEGAKLILHLIPNQSLSSTTEFTAIELEEAARYTSPLGSNDGTRRYNVDGFASSGATGYVQISRNGAIEAVLVGIVYGIKEPQDCNLLRAVPIAKALMNGVPQYLRILAALTVAPPVQCLISLVGAKDCRIGLDDEPSRNAIDRDIVEMPVGTVTDLAVAGHVIFKPILDVMWNAAGLPQCPHFNRRGLWEEPRPRGSIYA